MKKVLNRAQVVAISLVLLSPSAMAERWQLDDSASTMDFTSVKNKTITEHHQFTKLRGGIEPDGKLELRIDLHAVETNIPIRNERMRGLLFHERQDAVFTANLGTDFEARDEPIRRLSGTLQLNDVTRRLSFVVEVMPISDREVSVSSVAPISIDATRYNLLPGIEALREVAGLLRIEPIIPVSFKLTLRRE